MIMQDHIGKSYMHLSISLDIRHQRRWLFVQFFIWSYTNLYDLGVRSYTNMQESVIYLIIWLFDLGTIRVVFLSRIVRCSETTFLYPTHMMNLYIGGAVKGRDLVCHQYYRRRKEQLWVVELWSFDEEGEKVVYDGVEDILSKGWELIKLSTGGGADDGERIDGGVYTATIAERSSVVNSEIWVEIYWRRPCTWLSILWIIWSTYCC